ncbi:MAG: iron ABC transporter permease [Chloroflexota bacterium]
MADSTIQQRQDTLRVRTARRLSVGWQLPVWTSLILPLLITVAILIPIGLLAVEILTPTVDLWQRMWSTFLPRVIWNTLRLVLGVGVGTLVVGSVFAWLVTAFEFPGRRWFDHMLLLPLSIPGFVIGFIYVATFEFAGPVQTVFRNMFGLGRGDYWFPDITAPGGLIFVLTLVLYPYVYILARAAFREQAASTFEAAQVMGYSRTQSFFRLVLPLARPQIAAGTILAMMEAMTDYGTVSFFGYPTLSERVVVIWNTEYDLSKAAELSMLMVFIALGMIILERSLRGRAKFYQQGGRGRRPRRMVLHGWKKWGSTAACVGLLVAAFFFPAAQLVTWAVTEVRSPTVGLWQETFTEYTVNSMVLSGSAALGATMLALLIAYGVRATSTTGNRFIPRMLSRLVTLGYAMPGAVIAAGVLVFVNPLDGPITDFATNNLGWTSPAYVLTGTITALVYAYIVRFMSVGFNSVESSMDKVTPNMEGAARIMGAGSWRVLTRIHMPLVGTGMAAGAILIFVDVMKELPATLLLRPFGMDTLALWTYFLSSEAWWEAASIPALTIVVVGLIPVFILMRVGDNEVDQ